MSSPAPDDGRHECPYPLCRRRIQFHLLACRAHWFVVSPATRSRVQHAWQLGSDDYPDARAAALEEMRAHAEARGATE